jgi:hypothetical protein
LIIGGSLSYIRDAIGKVVVLFNGMMAKTRFETQKEYRRLRTWRTEIEWKNR